MSIRVEDSLPKGWTDRISRVHPRLGLGLDIATTEKKKSNPSALALTQQIGLTYWVRLLIRWKTQDPAVTRAILSLIIAQLAEIGMRGRRLCIDATNERFFAADLRSEFAGKIPVELVISSETTSYRGEDMSMKAYLGNLLINTLDDGYLALPPEPWIQKDFRQVIRVRDTFDADVAEDGSHADGFDATKLSLKALIGAGGPVMAEAVAVGGSTKPSGIRAGIKNKLWLRRNRERRNNA